MSTQGIADEYFQLEDETDAELLAMQCGDFYEFFSDTAEKVAEILDLETSEKSSHGSSYTMAGVPITDFEPYVQVLVEHGYRVAIANQYENSDGSYEREIDRVVTPGTLLETTDSTAQYFCTLAQDSEVDEMGVAFVDVTTGKFVLGSIDTQTGIDEILTEIYRFDPVEIIPGPVVRDNVQFMDKIRSQVDATITLHTKESFAPGRAQYALENHFGQETLDSIGVTSEQAIIAGGAAISYISDTGVGVLESFTRIQTIGSVNNVSIDATTQRNLELTKTMKGGTENTVVDTINRTSTSAGYRLLREWVTQPINDIVELEKRQDCVTSFMKAVLPREQLQETLEGAYDLERLAGRAASGYLSPKELQKAVNTLQLVGDVQDLITSTPQLQDSPVADLINSIDHTRIKQLANYLDDALVDNPPRKETEGGIISLGYDEELDEIITEHEEVLDWISSLATQEQNKHGITHLSVDRTQTDGYYIQVGKSEVDQVPEEYNEIKSLKNSKRYTIPELQEKERDVLRLEEKRHVLEQKLFNELQHRVAKNATLLQETGQILAEIDVYTSLADHASHNDWVKPTLTTGNDMDISEGRHPVVEQTTNFVPNDVWFHDDRTFLIVTGPNMSGKSTYMRQIALITLLAQIGSYVPASEAKIPLVDGIYTRVGALDELAQGRSTFLVEMQELSNILHSATENSLVILDEVGRGTATYDGISIAWAATEYLHNTVQAKTLFATHYHELTALADTLPRVHNVHVEADESNDDVTFLRTVKEGPTDKSYGVHVADMAGVPQPVVTRAHDVLEKLRQEKEITTRGGSTKETTQMVFDTSTGKKTKQNNTTNSDTPSQLEDEYGENIDEIVEEFANIDVNNQAPLDVVRRVRELQSEIR